MTCPLPIKDYPKILLAHGGGGRLMQQLVEKVFVENFKNPFLDNRHDSAVLKFDRSKLAFTTDSYVIKPLFFPGGNIGSLAVYGTVNDLAMAGAVPKYLSAGFIIEEGLETEALWKIVQAMKEAAERCSVQIVTGDTKVVDKGKGDGIFINTAGIGVINHPFTIAPQSIQPGDQIVISGDLGRHGIAVLGEREGISFSSPVESDATSLSPLVQALLEGEISVHCLRDLTRGGLASALNEIAETRKVRIHIDERAVKVSREVEGACEMLGLDPLYVANEGRLVTFVSPDQAGQALQIMKHHDDGKEASIIGEVGEAGDTRVTLTNKVGTKRILDMLSGEQLPRIC